MAKPDFDFTNLDTDNDLPKRGRGQKKRSRKNSRQKKKKKRRLPTVLIGMVAIVCFAIVGCLVVLFNKESTNKEQSNSVASVQSSNQRNIQNTNRTDSQLSATTDTKPNTQSSTVRSITKQLTVNELSLLNVDVSALSSVVRNARFKIVQGPSRARVSNGQLSWTPDESDGPQKHQFVIESFLGSAKKPISRLNLFVDVLEVNQPPKIDPVLPVYSNREDGISVKISATDPDSPNTPLKYEMQQPPLGAKIDQEGLISWSPTENQTKSQYTLQVLVTEATPSGLTSSINVPILFGAELAKGNAIAQTDTEMLDPNAQTTLKPNKGLSSLNLSDLKEHGEQEIVQLYRDRELFKANQYEVLRKIHSTRFEQKHEDKIRAALGEDYDDAMTWFDQHQAIKEEFFTAINQDRDEIPGAIRMFESIRKKHPKQIVPLAPLAIATSVVWDNGKGVYRYGGHQRRTHSTMPENLLEGLENFQYMVDATAYMQGRGKYLPWEFLVHVVNHPTPVQERKWAVVNYVSKRPLFGKCYHDVPYDNEMLQTGSKICRLSGKPYTLPNVKTFGGVCAMQADFAARVGKSIGVPAAYVSGKGRFGGSHAWVMWVEVLNVNASGVQFELKSHGRYRGDHYYVGNLRHPQTGVGMTDRQLELDLQSVGIGPLNKRRGDWLIAAYPVIAKTENLSVIDRMEFLGRVLQVSPLNTQAWRELAQMSRSGEITRKHEKLMLNNLTNMFNRFAKFPDFTFEVFDDLIAFQDNIKIRDVWYGKLVALYENAGRPDLACKARLKYTDYLEELDKPLAAIAGLGFTVMKFPQEGRYVPPLLDRLEKLAPQVKGANLEVIKLYKVFLPKIQRKRSNAPSKYCMKMYRRGIERFKQAGDLQAAAFWTNELSKLESIDIKL